jgi:glycosyltransferase involved in cell wall biosynthesis
VTTPSLTPAGQVAGSTAGAEPSVAPAGRLCVVHVIDSLAGSGGAENRLVDEVTALTDRFDQTVVHLFERDFLAVRLADAGVPVVALGFTAGRAGWSWPVVGQRLTRLLRDLQPDVIHTSLFTGNLVGQLAGARLGVPVLSTFNRTGERLLQRALQPGVASWRGRLMQAVSRRAARRDHVHYRAVGEYALETNCVSMRLPAGAATVVPRGVTIGAAELTAASAAGRAAFGLPEGRPLFVNVARLVPEKAQHLLVEAFARVRAELPAAHLAIAGATGPAAPVVQAAIEREGVGDAVTLLGFRDDARALVASADVFVFSSMSEGSPGAVLEAMASGAPVAAFGIPPVAELTAGDRHAWLAEPGDPAALAAAMLAVWRAPDRAERAAATQAWAQRHYSLAAVAEQLGDLLEARARGAAVLDSRTLR